MAATFKTDTEAVLADLHSALRALLDALPGSPFRGPSDLSRSLGIGFRQAWQTHRFAHATVPLVEASHLPLEGSFQRILRAAAQSGADSALIERARDAWGRLERVIDTHARERGVFDSIVTNVAGAPATSLDKRHKRAMYRSARHLWGIDMDFRFVTMIVNPGAGKDLVDVVALRGTLGARRYQPGVPFYSISAIANDAAAVPGAREGDASAIRREPLVEPLADGIPLLPDFCTRPLPPMTAEALSPNALRLEFLPADVGMRAALDFVSGEVIRNVPGPWTDERGPELSASVTLRAPCRTLQIDVLHHRDHFPPQSAEVGVFIDRCVHSATMGGPFGDADRLSVAEPTTELRTAAHVLSSPDYARYDELVRFAMDRVGWDLESIRGHRCRIEHPIIQTSVQLNVHLGSPPE